MKIAILQMNSIVGDFDNNSNKIIKAAKEAVKNGADVLVTPEMSLTGYPVEDLIFRSSFFVKLQKAMDKIFLIKDIILIIGCISVENGKYFNTAIILKNGKVLVKYFKEKLPNIGVFDELRYFYCGDNNNSPAFFEFNKKRIGILICEDIWYCDPVKKLSKLGCELIIIINASPFYLGKLNDRINVVKQRVHENKINFLYVNSTGGQDELVFDGNSFLIDKNQNLVFQDESFNEKLSYLAWDTINDKFSGNISKNLSYEESLYKAIVLGIKDYVFKSGFNKICLGLSGGIDSALVLVMAIEAIGAKNCRVLIMPSKYTSILSSDIAVLMAKNLKVSYDIIPIDNIFNEFKKSLSSVFLGLSEDITEENLQSRIRGVLLMAMSNKLGSLLLSTSNKSEIFVGYSTLYGDMNGGFAPIKDLLKTQAYEIANWINSTKGKQIIPQFIIDRAPTAELNYNQKDQDVLPRYEVLDKIIPLIMEHNMSKEELISFGFNELDVKKAIRLVNISEYKRRQSPIGPKVSKVSFGKDWRYPICYKFDF